MVYNPNKANIRSIALKRRNTMSDREKLIEYITNLTDAQIEEFIAFLKTIPSAEAVLQLLHPCNSAQDQEVSA